MSIENKRPPINVDHLTYAINKIKTENLPENDFHEAQKVLLDALKYIPHLIYEFNKDDGFDTKLYRAQNAETIEKHNHINQINAFSYPPPDKCKVARANKKGFPVFYVSETSETAIKESRCETGDMIYLSEWEMDIDKKFRVCSFLTAEDMKNTNIKIASLHRDNYIEALNKVSSEDKKKIEIIHEIYSDIFMEEEYKVSSIVGHYLLCDQNKESVDLLFYPSKANGYRYSNIAIAADFSDRYLKLNKVSKVKIGTDKSNYEIIKEGEITNKKIHWD